MTLLEQIREALGRIAQLTAEELATVRSQITECFDQYDAEEATPENVAVLNELADAGEAVMSRSAEMEAAAKQAEADKVAARERIAKINGTVEEPEAEEPEGTDPEAEADAEQPEGAEPEPVTASGTRRPGTTISRMAAGRRPGDTGRSPEADPEWSATALVATGNMTGRRSGEVLGDRYDLAESMSETLKRMRKTDRPVGDVVLASAAWTYPEDRTLESGPDKMMSLRDAKAIDAVCHPQALVATGGICAPVNVDYSLGTWAVADRPLRDGLPAFQASRGGLTFRVPPAFSALAAATGIWTAATDANPAGATKPVEIIACPSSSTVLVSAVSTRLGFGNMMSQFDPETVAANTDLAIAAAARKAEVNLLTQISAASVAAISTAAVMGAARDYLATLDKALAIYKNVNRLSDSQTVTVIVPRWIKSLIRIDRVRELAHDSVGVDPLAIPDAWIEDMFSIRNVKPIFTLDSLPQNGGTWAAQDFTGFTASSAIPTFPGTLVWHMFVEGAIQFLDGGRLDLGVVRDSTLDSTNDYETFVETFEGIANRSFSGGVLQFNTTICANGQSGAAVTVGSCA